MKINLILTIVVILSINSHALTIRKGDILLQSIPCWSCWLIEKEENSAYSHLALVVETNPIQLIEAFGEVKMTNLNDFLSRTQKNTRVLVRRPVQLLTESNINIEYSSFLDSEYDAEFIWNNGNKYYCSELVTKIFIQHHFDFVPTKKMSFKKYWSAWSVYFQGRVPEGEEGNSPGDYAKSQLFINIGEL